MQNQPHALYLHIPFCTTKCTYCAFNTYINLEALIPAFVDALVDEIRLSAQSVPPMTTLDTVFFGGGTPSLLTPLQFKSILTAIYDNYSVEPGAEITTEANPNDLTYDYLAALREMGINRISLGMQSAVAEELRVYARRHDHEVVQRVMPELRQAGFERVNIDLIYGGPRQTLESWRYTLAQTVALNPEHISLYALGLEEGTPLLEWVENGQMRVADEDLAADMYDEATTALAQAGYSQYEISNWAKPGEECRHNLAYWRNSPYIGLGPGAHGWAGGVRYATELSPQRYIQKMQDGMGRVYEFPKTPATLDEVVVSQSDEIAETLMMGLRLTQEGIGLPDFQKRFGVSLLDLHGETLRGFETRGLIEIAPDRVRFTEQGRLLSNMVLRELV